MNTKFFVLFFVLASCVLSQSAFETSPSVISVQPASGSTDFVLGDKITILFDSPIKCSSNCVAYIILGNRVTNLLIDDSMIDGQELTLIPQLQEDKTYIITIPQGAILGLNDMPFHGFHNYSIHTADISEPTLVNTIPAANGEIDPVSNIQLVFNKNVFITGNWTASITCGEEIIEVTSDIPVVDEKTISIAIDFPSYIFCTLHVDYLSIIDQNGNEFTDVITLPFNTKDVIAPTVSFSLQPVNDLTDASRISDIVFTLEDQSALHINAAIDGGISIHTSTDVFLYTADKVTITGNTVVIANEVIYPLGETVVVKVPNAFFVDSGDNGNAAVEFTFTVTEIATQPVVTGVVSTSLFTSDYIQFVFDSAIAVGAGSVSLQGVQVNHAIFIDVENCVATENVLSCPFTNAIEGAEYAVRVASGVVLNILGNGNEFTVLEQTVYIHTLQNPTLVMEQCYPAQDTTTVPLNTTVQITWNQPVNYNTDCVIEAKGYITPSELHTVELISSETAFKATQTFTVDNLYAFTQYTIYIPDACFVNSANLTNEMTSYSFMTTRTEAPSLISFNLEGQQDVVFDAPMQFIFNQPLTIAEGAILLVKPRDGASVERVISVVDGNTLTIYNQEASLRFASKTQYTVYIPEDVICNSDGLCMEATALSPFTTVTESISRVILQHTVPSSGATQVNAEDPIVLHFTGNVRAASGVPAHYYIYDGDFAIEGTATIEGREVSLSFPLQSGKTYTYVYDMNLFTTTKGSPVYYDIGSSFSFTVADTKGPSHYSFTCDKMQSVEVRFDEDVLASTGVLTIRNSAGEEIVPPITANIATATNRLVIYLSAQNLVDDVYTFSFGAGFVKDIYGNDSPAFTEEYILDRVPFEVTEVSVDNAFDAIRIEVSKTIGEVDGSVIIDGAQRCVVDLIECAVEGKVVSIPVSLCGNHWSSGKNTISITADSIKDVMENPLVEAKNVEVTIPEIGLLQVNADLSVPTMGNTVSIIDILSTTIEIAFDHVIEIAKPVQLRSSTGCVVAGEGSFMVNGTTVIVHDINSECLSGTIYLAAPAGALVSYESAMESAASTAETPLYSFAFMTSGPSPVSAAAVYYNGLQITANSRIDITFNMDITASEATLAALPFLHFYDNENNEIAFAKTIHGEIDGAVLRVIVDEPFNPLLSTQIRSVVIVPMARENTIYGVDSDVASGSEGLSRVFSLPPVTTQVQLIGEKTIQPTIAIVFDQNVMKSEQSCAALMVSDNQQTVFVSTDDIVAVDEKHFTWTPSVMNLLAPSTEYTFIADNTCFVIADTNTYATGISSSLVFTTMEDTLGPVVIGAGATVESEPAFTVAMTSPFLYLMFNEEVEIKEDGILFFAGVDTNEVIQVPASSSLHKVSESIMMVNLVGKLLSNLPYDLLIENAIVDKAGNAMQNMNQSIRIITATSCPNAVTNLHSFYLDTNSLMVTFDAAVDMNLKEGTGPCTYIFVSSTMSIQSFEDVCVSPNYQGEPIHLSFLVNDIDYSYVFMYFVHVDNGVTCMEHDNTVIDYLLNEGTVNAAPEAPKLISIQSVEEEPAKRLVKLQVDRDGSFTRILGYTFMVQSTASSKVYDVVFTPESTIYELVLDAYDSAIAISMKVTTETSSSAFSEPLVIEQPAVVSTVPAKITEFTSSQYSLTEAMIAWTPVESREEILSYTLVFNDNSTMTVTVPEARLPINENLVVEFSIYATNAIGDGELTTFSHIFSDELTAVVKQVTTGSSFAVVTFETSFNDVNIECALNAGHLIYATGSIVGDKEARVVINNLIAGLHYAGSCWAYALNHNVVSSSIPLSFTTATITEEATLTVADFTYVDSKTVKVSVSIDIPAVVYCTVADSEIHLVHSDIVALGSSVECAMNGPQELYLSMTASANKAVYCTAENSMHKKVTPIVSISVPSIQVISIPASYVSSIQNGDKDVSVNPVITLTFNAKLSDVDEPALFLENMETHEKITLAVSYDNEVVTASLPKRLDYNTHYTLYTALQPVFTFEDDLIQMMPIHYGEIQFTTTAIDDAPTPLSLLSEFIVDPSTPFTLQFNREMKVNAEKDIIVENVATKAAFPVVAAVEENGIHFTVLGLTENTEYELVIAECAVEDIYGNCLPAMKMAFTIDSDVAAPLVSSLNVADKTNVPNDTPLVLTFNEVVTLNNVNHIAVLSNNIIVPLNKHNVVVDKNEVTIHLDRGYNMGYSSSNAINVRVIIDEDAFRDLAGNANEFFEGTFVASPQRCGSSYLSTFMEDTCNCYSEAGKCWCSCGLVNLFEL